MFYEFLRNIQSTLRLLSYLSSLLPGFIKSMQISFHIYKYSNFYFFKFFFMKVGQRIRFGWINQIFVIKIMVLILDGN